MQKFRPNLFDLQPLLDHFAQIYLHFQIFKNPSLNGIPAFYISSKTNHLFSNFSATLDIFYGGLYKPGVMNVTVSQCPTNGSVQ